MGNCCSFTRKMPQHSSTANRIFVIHPLSPVQTKELLIDLGKALGYVKLPCALKHASANSDQPK